MNKRRYFCYSLPNSELVTHLITLFQGAVQMFSFIETGSIQITQGFVKFFLMVLVRNHNFISFIFNIDSFMSLSHNFDMKLIELLWIYSWADTFEHDFGWLNRTIVTICWLRLLTDRTSICKLEYSKAFLLVFDFLLLLFIRFQLYVRSDITPNAPKSSSFTCVCKNHRGIDQQRNAGKIIVPIRHLQVDRYLNQIREETDVKTRQRRIGQIKIKT